MVHELHVLRRYCKYNTVRYLHHIDAHRTCCIEHKLWYSYCVYCISRPVTSSETRDITRRYSSKASNWSCPLPNRYGSSVDVLKSHFVLRYAISIHFSCNMLQPAKRPSMKFDRPVTSVSPCSFCICMLSYKLRTPVFRLKLQGKKSDKQRCVCKPNTMLINAGLALDHGIWNPGKRFCPWKLHFVGVTEPVVSIFFFASAFTLRLRYIP